MPTCRHGPNFMPRRKGLTASCSVAGGRRRVLQRLAERQRDFGAALLDPMGPAPSGLMGPDGQPSTRRFSVYRNNVVAGLIEILKDSFPAVHRIVGTDFFTAM